MKHLRRPKQPGDLATWCGLPDAGGVSSRTFCDCPACLGALARWEDRYVRPTLPPEHHAVSVGDQLDLFGGAA